MTTSLAQLTSQVRLLTSMEVSEFVTDDEIAIYLNWGLAALDDLMINQFEDYKLTTVDLVLASAPTDGSNYIDLPADFLKNRGVDWQRGTGWVSLDRDALAGRHRGTDSFEQFYGHERQYRVTGDRLYIDPWQTSPGTYRLHYIPQLTLLAAPTDQLPGYLDKQQWCQYAVLEAVIKIISKQEMDASQWIGQKAELYGRIQNASKVRDAGPPKSAEQWHGRGRRRNGF